MDTNIEILKGLLILTRSQERIIYLLEGLQSNRVIENNYEDERARKLKSDIYYFTQETQELIEDAREHELRTEF